jgi:hypothetical protein
VKSLFFGWKKLLPEKLFVGPADFRQAFAHGSGVESRDAA